MGWSLSDIGIGGATVALTTLGIIPSLIIVGVIFLIAAVTMFALGLVSAVIYTLAAVGVLWIISLLGVFRNVWSHPWTLLFFLLIPAGFLWGYGTDHIKGLTMAAPAQWISSNPALTMQQDSLAGKSVAFIMTPQVFGGILIFAGAVILAAVLMLKWKPKKHKHR
jgi:hypothetical protein